MKGYITVEALVLLGFGSAATYVAYHNPPLGAALLVGVGVVALLIVLLRDRTGDKDDHG